MLHRLDASAFGLAPGEFDAEVQLITEETIQKTVPVLPTKRKLRILALHGFGQSGDYLRIAMKTGQLTQYLHESLDTDLLSQYEGVEWLCPDGPLRLVPDSRYDEMISTGQDVDIFAWWRILDFHIQHEHLYRSLEYLAKYIQEHGPVDGIIGFSQGAAVAMMLTALCEGTPERRAALVAQGAPLLMPPPQAPFKFAVACCGFQNAVQFYNGFYNPRISTPSLHVVAEFDTMVSAEQSASLAEACEDAAMIHFRGTHHVPTDRATLYEMARFIANACTNKSIPSPLGVTYALPSGGVDSGVAFKEATVTVAEIESDGSQTPSTPSLSSSRCSSLSGFSSASRKTHVRVMRRTTVVRRMPVGGRQRNRLGS